MSKGLLLVNAGSGLNVTCFWTISSIIELEIGVLTASRILIRICPMYKISFSHSAASSKVITKVGGSKWLKWFLIWRRLLNLEYSFSMFNSLPEISLTHLNLSLILLLFLEPNLDLSNVQPGWGENSALL